MTKVENYRAELRNIGIKEWDAYLLNNSGLPGRRGNIELARAFALEGNRENFDRYLAYNSDIAPVNTPEEFFAFCGVLGCGRLLSEGDDLQFKTLRACAGDPRWRIREGVAMALQMLGRSDMDRLILEMETWSRGSPLVQRAAAAGLCEPDMLFDERDSRRTIDILDRIMVSIIDLRDRKSAGFIALRKGLGYCWSVAVAANPDYGKPFFEKWLENRDKDIRWIMKQNLTKKRLMRMDKNWVEKCIAVI